MTRLARPDVRLLDSWAAAVAEWGDASDMHGSGLWAFESVDTTAEGGRRVVEHLLAEEDPANVAEDKVPCTYFWILDGEPDAGEAAGEAGEFVGYLALRHSLNAWLLEEGGHIGYSVRPSRRREGHAARALALALEHAAALGIDRVLVTADEDNLGSQRVILGAGGVLEDTRNGKRRYWIDTAATAAATATARPLERATGQRGR